MPMTVVVARNVSGRVRGFLASCMLEVAPGLYTAPRMSAGVRERVEGVLTAWFPYETDASIVLLWADSRLPEGQGMVTLGSPPYKLLEYDGIVLSTLAGR